MNTLPHDKPIKTEQVIGRDNLSVSVVTPVFQEEGNVEELCSKLFAVLDDLGRSFEIVAVNDGSTDKSFELLKAIGAERKELKIVDLARNQGQTAAIMAGIEHANGDTLIFIDADLQNDPDDIPKLLNKLDEGYDVVSGWRASRQDAPIRRNFVSRVANSLISKLSGVHLNDYGCTLKAYRRKFIKDVKLYGEMHRFIPIYASWTGARITEMPVQHHARQHGTSKYGLERVAKVMLDLMVVMLLDKYIAKPIYVFGGFGFFSMLASVFCLIWMVVLKYFFDTSMIQTPLPVLSSMFLLVGVLSIFVGLVAEILVRTYFESPERKSYVVAETINFDIDS